MSWTCSRCGHFEKTFYNWDLWGAWHWDDKIGELKSHKAKLQSLQAWESAFDNYQHLCAKCIDQIFTKECSVCKTPFGVLEDCREKLLANLNIHGQPTETFADKKNICPACYGQKAFIRCVRCKQAFHEKSENLSLRYHQNEAARSWLRPCHLDARFDEIGFGREHLCVGCYDELQKNAGAVKYLYDNWAGNTKAEYLKGFDTIKELGRIEENRRMENIDYVADHLKLYAAQIGGNAYTHFFWERHSEKYVAGHGPKGNPFFETDVWYTGSAMAVLVEERSKRSSGSTPAQNDHSDLEVAAGSKQEGAPATFYVVDGLNVIRSVDSRKDASLGVLLTMLLGMKAKGLDFACLFDASTPHILHEIAEPDSKQIYRHLIKKLPEQFLEVPAGTKADDYILDYAHTKNVPIVSNDRFKDYFSKYPWVANKDRRIPAKVIVSTLKVLALGISCELRTDLDLMAKELLANKV